MPVYQISEEEKEKIIQDDVNETEEFIIKIHGKEKWEHLLELACLLDEDNDYQKIRRYLALDIYAQTNKTLNDKLYEYNHKIANVNNIYSYIYLNLKNNNLLNEEDKTTKTNMAVYITELFYRFFYNKPMIKDVYYFAHLDKPYITIKPLTVNIKDIDEVERCASFLSDEQQQLISICIKTSVISKSISELFDDFLNNKLLIAYRETVVLNSKTPATILSHKINYDAQNLREILNIKDDKLEFIKIY